MTPEHARGGRRSATGWVVVTGILVLLGASAVAVWFALRPVEGGGPAPVVPGAPTPEPTPSPSDDAWAGWSLEEQVGQVFMVGVDVASPQQVSTDAIRQDHVGNLFLQNRTHAGAAPTRTLVDSFTALVSDATTHGTPLLVATDQEGGQVQVLQGPGFSTIPAAVDQAQLDPADLRAQATTWGGELAGVGVDLNLAPVMDLVPDQATAGSNPPVGALGRSYGFTPGTVTSHANAFADGMRAAGVDVAIKHFPGLGRVTEDTDSADGVTDTVTTRDDASVDVFRSGIEAGAECVMVSTAVYSRIDPGTPAAFSSTVVGGMLRGDLGFDGLVVTDDLSGAEQVAAWSPGDRAVLALDAGVDLVLVSKDPTVAHAMVTAVLGRARADAAFRAKVEAAARRVLETKGQWPPGP
ncbi:glycoside hydrolase family 3 N-terminal domain-containing protein [Cellulomonas chitinilytica]|uniref:glycoside hydrolase family 3 N-terminal domain-containing protein n=1 Tax=Cellulomonas chitinilytica TaxID=398759 RepID=UPI001EF39700|nr:glycoside hydrolase family 3 N-terminal domain-containing protein [Cellulomonas chitinilytica]